MRIVVQTKDFDSGAEIAQLASQSNGVGAVNSFIGFVRDNNEDTHVGSLFLEHYPEMTEKQIQTILEEAQTRWAVLSATVIHRIGELLPGEQIVFVGVASPHRGDAFDACEFIIDYLKTRATFWKKESTPDGFRWLETRQNDLDSAAEWDRDNQL